MISTGRLHELPLLLYRKLQRNPKKLPGFAYKTTAAVINWLELFPRVADISVDVMEQSGFLRSIHRERERGKSGRDQGRKE